MVFLQSKCEDIPTIPMNSICITCNRLKNGGLVTSKPYNKDFLQTHGFRAVLEGTKICSNAKN